VTEGCNEGGPAQDPPEPRSALLHVDHDREARPVVARFLSRVGSLRSVGTLAEARAAVAAEPPALLVIDPGLPDGDGTELIAEVRARHPWAQIFAIPRPSWADQTSRFIAAGANDVAVKPFDVGKLPARAHALLRAAEKARREVAYRERLESRLLHVERIATLGTLCATVAHELASPLTLVNAHTHVIDEILRSGAPLEPERLKLRDAASEIRVASRLMRTLVQHLRTFSRRQERKRVKGPLDPIVDGALLLVKPRLGHGIALHLPEGPAPVVPHYPIRLTQALINLLTNAVEAVGATGNVTLRYIDEPDAAGIAVDDDGPGLSEEARLRASEPFFTSKAEGTGLGLVLVRAIMGEHEGRFELAPGPAGRGASARLLLPRAIEERPTLP
jgi:two-component system, NtrC family, sensor histidine kinase HydH